MRVRDNAVQLDAKERNRFVEVYSTIGAIGRLAKPGSKLQESCQQLSAGLQALLAKGETISLEESVAGSVGTKAS